MKNPNGLNRGIRKVLLDGNPLPNNLIPLAEASEKFGRYPLKDSDLILDLGAGGCNLASYVQKNFRVRVCALDRCLEYLIGGKAFMDYFQVDSNRFCRVCASALNLPFVDESFDHVIGSAILHHFEYPSQALKEVRRVLKSGGYGIFSMELVSPYFRKPDTSHDDHPKTPEQWRYEVDESRLKMVYLGLPEDSFTWIRNKFGFCPEWRSVLTLLNLYLRTFRSNPYGYVIVVQKK